jgi:hypothetical protein
MTVKMSMRIIATFWYGVVRGFLLQDAAPHGSERQVKDGQG